MIQLTALMVLTCLAAGTSFLGSGLEPELEPDLDLDLELEPGAGSGSGSVVTEGIICGHLGALDPKLQPFKVVAEVQLYQTTVNGAIAVSGGIFISSNLKSKSTFGWLLMVQSDSSFGSSHTLYVRCKFAHSAPLVAI